MTSRRVVLVALTLAAPILVLWAQHARDLHRRWYDPIERRLDWHYPRCLP